jgi:hypothetical protein
MLRSGDVHFGPFMEGLCRPEAWPGRTRTDLVPIADSVHGPGFPGENGSLIPVLWRANPPPAGPNGLTYRGVQSVPGQAVPRGRPTVVDGGMRTFLSADFVFAKIQRSERWRGHSCIAATILSWNWV